MRELMTVSQALTMSSFDLLELVNDARLRHGEVKIENRHFLVRIEDELDGELPPRKNFTHPSNGLAIGYYDLTLDQCRLVGMRESKGVRRWVLERLKEREAPKVPTTMAQALRLAAEQAELLERQQAQLALAAPKVEYVDRYVAANGALGFRQVAKLLKAKEPEFRAFLEDKKILYRLQGKLTPYQNHIEAGRFELKTGVTQNEHAFTQARFTPKGVKWVAGEWAKYQLTQQVAA